MMKELWARVLEWVAMLFPHDPKVRYILVGFILILLVAFATKCRAESLEFELGSTAVRGVTPALAVTLDFKDAGPGDSDYQCGIVLIGQTEGNHNQAGIHCLIVDGFGKLDLGLGVGVLQNEDEYNSGRFQFSLMAGYRITDRLSVRYRHFSNCGTSDPNKGRDLLLVSWKFR